MSEKKYYVVGREGGGKEVVKLIPGKDPGSVWCRGLYSGSPYRSSRGPYNTEEEALASLSRNGEPTTECTVCHYLIDFNYFGSEKLIERKMCFTCSSWTDTVERHHKDQNSFVIDGVTYSDAGRSSDKRSMLGFGGREFLIETFDGRRISTNNLWCGGDIPPHFKQFLPDDAKFVNDKKWVEASDGTQYLSDT